MSNLIKDIIIYYEAKDTESDHNAFIRYYKDEIFKAIRRGVALERNGKIKEYEDIKKEAELYFNNNCITDEEE